MTPRPVSTDGLPANPTRGRHGSSSTSSPVASSAGTWEQGPTPETDEAIDKLRVLRAWTARRLVNRLLGPLTPERHSSPRNIRFERPEAWSDQMEA